MEIARPFKALWIVGVLLALAGLLISLLLPELEWLVTICEGIALVCLIGFFIVHFQSIKAFSSRRSARLGINSVISIILAVAIVGIVNSLAARHSPQWDFSETQSFTLTRQTYQVMRALQDDVQIKVFSHNRSPLFLTYRNLLNTYTQETPKITVQFVDPDRQPDVARDYDISRVDTAVLESKTKRIYVREASEVEITNALVRVTQNVPKRIVFLTGHGEKSLHNEEQSGLSRAKVALIKQGYAVESRALLETDPIPENTSVLVIAAPTRSIPEGGQQLIQGYVGNGGHLLILADPQSDNSLTQLTRRWGVELGKGIVVDTRDRLGRGSPTALLIRTFTGHDITDEFTIPVFLPVSRYLEFDPVQGTQWEFVSLAQTSSESWAEMDLENKSPELNPEVDVKGPFTIAAALTPKTAMDTTKPQSAIVVVGNSAFATNGYLHYPGNTDFFLQIMAWLAQEDQLVSITPKEPAFRPFVPNPSQEQALLFFQVLFLPFFSLFIGFSIWRKRSRL